MRTGRSDRYKGRQASKQVGEIIHIDLGTREGNAIKQKPRRSATAWDGMGMGWAETGTI